MEVNFFPRFIFFGRGGGVGSPGDDFWRGGGG